jgi:hypothetical protein
METKEVVERFRGSKEGTDKERSYYADLESYFDSSVGSNVEKLQNFSKYAPRQTLTNFLCRYEMFKRILNIQGNIVECGVLFGGGLMSFAQLSAIFEPVNHQRRVIGFDTFAGFPSVHAKDQKGVSHQLREGGFAIDSYKDLQESIRLFDANRFVGHVPKVELVKGDATKTIPQYLKDNPHTVVSLLYLDMDIYEPTKVALKHFLPRIPKGGIIAFDELNNRSWPGETLATMEEVGIPKLRLERFSFGSVGCYAVLE